MTRILWIGDLSGTGFGSVTLDCGRALMRLGHDVRFLSQNEFGGRDELPADIGPRTFMVNDEDGWQKLAKAGSIAPVLDGRGWDDGWAAEAVVALGDHDGVHIMVMHDEASKEAFGSVPTFHYCPIEGVDLPPSWADMWQIITPIAVSEFGAQQIATVTGTKPPVIYHGVDTDQFAPVTVENPVWIGGKAYRSKGDCKALFGGSKDKRWIFRADRFMPRKRYASMLRAVAPLMATRRDLFTVIHCRSDDQGGNLYNLFSKYPPFISKRMLMTGFHDIAGAQGASRDILRALYNAADVYVSVSAEGFGLTIAEAIACGTPAVGLDYSAVPEVIGPAGLVAPVAYLLDNEYDHAWAAVNEKAFGGMVASLLDDEVLRKRLGREGPAHVKANFSWDRAAIAMSAVISDRLREVAA